MIQINLLPPEKRKKEKTPLPRFLVMTGAVAACFILGFWNINGCIQLKNLNKDLVSETINKEILKKAVEPYEKMEQEEAALKARQNLVQEVIKTRTFLWWQAVDALWDVICEYPTVWITSLDGTTEGLTSTQSGKPMDARITFKVFSAGPVVQHVMDFRTRLKKHKGTKEKPGVADIFDGGINEPPSYKIVKERGEDSVQFDIELKRLQPAQSSTGSSQ